MGSQDQTLPSTHNQVATQDGSISIASNLSFVTGVPIRCIKVRASDAAHALALRRRLEESIHLGHNTSDLVIKIRVTAIQGYAESVRNAGRKRFIPLHFLWHCVQCKVAAQPQGGDVQTESVAESLHHGIMPGHTTHPHCGT